jgi:hypothetical protein
MKMKTIVAVLMMFLVPFAGKAGMVDQVEKAVETQDVSCIYSYLVSMDVVDDIAAAIRSGNAEALSKYFADNVDLKVLEQENIYSRAQAELILKDFFAKHPIEEFTVVHKSVPKNESQFAIGTLKTSNGVYRVHYLMKASGGSSSVTQFRIETSDE